MYGPQTVQWVGEGKRENFFSFLHFTLPLALLLWFCTVMNRLSNWVKTSQLASLEKERLHWIPEANSRNFT